MSRSPTTFNKSGLHTLRQMKRAGASADEISAVIGSKTGRSVMVRCSHLGITRKSVGFLGSISIKPKLAALYHAEAERRGLTPSIMVRLILTRIAQDNLFAAIIDDDK